MKDVGVLNINDCKNIVDICNISFSSLKLDDVTFVIDGEDGEIHQKLRLFLLPDTLLPIIAITANALANNLFETKFNDDVVFAYDVVKDEYETLCFARIVKNDKKEMDYIKQCLITTEIISQIFRPDVNRKINLTPLIKNWREFLNVYRDGELVNHKTIYNDLIDFSLNHRDLKIKQKPKNTK